MKFNTHAEIRGNPRFTLRAKPGPFHVEADAQGRAEVATGPIDAHLSAVPVALRIPFMKRSAGVRIASIGPCHLRIHPVQVELRALALHVTGVLAKEGMACEVTGEAACHMEVDLTGSIPGRITRAAVELAADPQDD